MSRLLTLWSFSWLVSVCIYAQQQLSTQKSGGITNVRCPSQASLLRNSGTYAEKNQKLNPAEEEYIETRRKKVVKSAYKTYLKNVQLSLLKLKKSKSDSKNPSLLPDYVQKIFKSDDLKILPRISIALSGGGYRATLYSAGILNSFDGRNSTSVGIGTGGLLQACDYLSGLSGGSWLLTALSQANFPLMYDLVLGNHLLGEENLSGRSFGGLLTQYGLFAPASNNTPGGLNQSQIEKLNYVYTLDVIEKMSEKLKSGFHVTMADFWSLVLRYHIINGTTNTNFFNQSLPHGFDTKFSDLLNLSSFQNYEQPFPIIRVLPISPGQDETKIRSGGAKVPVTNTAYEYTPLEFGSWDKELASFLPTQYLGTRLRIGTPKKVNECVQGFDKASYLAGISSNIFPTFNTSHAYFFNQSPIAKIITLINDTFSSFQPGISLDTASVPNPFLGMGTDDYLDKESTELRLLDGGLDGAATPYLPLLIPARKLDLIIGSDADAGAPPNYPTGASLEATFERAQLDKGAYGFPKVPENLTEYVRLRSHPTFFGCHSFTSSIIVWIPNSPPLDGSPAVTNTSISQLQYERSEVTEILSAATEIGYQGFPPPSPNPTTKPRDPHWPACLACAISDRSRERQNISRQGICSHCFERYCWPSSSSSVIYNLE